MRFKRQLIEPLDISKLVFALTEMLKKKTHLENFTKALQETNFF